LDRMTKAGVHPGVVTYSAVINGTFSHCLYHASSALCLRKCWTHSYIFSAWAKSKASDAVEHALSILGAMEENGLHPNVQTYNSVIDCIARRGENPEQAEAVLDRMVEAGVPPDVVSYNAVINGMFDCRLSMLRGPCACLRIRCTPLSFSLGKV
jgi:pentatricopeptide repeat protein